MLSSRILIHIITLLLLILLPVSSAIGSSRILSISAPNNLRYSNNDAKIIASAFGRYVGFERKDIKCICGKKSTKQNIMDGIRVWLRKDVIDGDIVVLFFAGHGVLIDQQFYLLPQIKHKSMTYETLVSLARSNELISRNEIIEGLHAVKSMNKLLIIDSCHSGAFFSNEIGDSRVNTANIIVRGISISQKPSNAPTLNEKIDFTVIAACKSNQFAAEDSRLNNGVLTHYMVQILRDWSKHNARFNALQLCSDISSRASRDGWQQDTISYGGNFFDAEFKSDNIQRFIVY